MVNTYFDTHDYVIQLAASGIPTEEAEAHAKALGKAMNNELAKKSDLKALGAETKADLNTLRAEIKADLNAFRAEAKADLNTFKAETRGQFELLKWMMGFVLAGIAAMTFKMFH
jgi:uncharacterized protein YnzC (UPF0291/DUF896 family)